MKVCVNPRKRVNGVPLAVVNPRTRRACPQGRVFDLTDEDLADPNVRRLLPRSKIGGRDGDLLPEDELSSADKSALKAIKKEVAEATPAAIAADEPQDDAAASEAE